MAGTAWGRSCEVEALRRVAFENADVAAGPRGLEHKAKHGTLDDLAFHRTNVGLIRTKSSQRGRSGIRVHVVRARSCCCRADAPVMIESRGHALAVLDLGRPDACGLGFLRHPCSSRRSLPALIPTACSDASDGAPGLTWAWTDGRAVRLRRKCSSPVNRAPIAAS